MQRNILFFDIIKYYCSATAEEGVGSVGDFLSERNKSLINRHAIVILCPLQRELL